MFLQNAKEWKYIYTKNLTFFLFKKHNGIE